MNDGTLRFYVLTSRNLKCLKRQFHSIPKEHTTVVVNALDESYVRLATEWCYENEVHCIVTKSNGKPGMGKNSCLDDFLQGEYSHMVLIDGDDFLQAHGVKLYSWLAKNDCTDGIQILHSKSWTNGRKPQSLFAPMPWQEGYRKWGQKMCRDYPHLEDNIKAMWKSKKEYHDLYVIHRSQNRKWNYPLDSSNPQDCARLILWNRKLAGVLRFREDLIIGEDTLLNFEARDLAYNAKITLKKVIDREELTYFYDLTNSGIVRRMQNAIDWDWMEPLNSAVAEREPYWTVPDTFRIEKVSYDFEKLEPLDLSKL